MDYTSVYSLCLVAVILAIGCKAQDDLLDGPTADQAVLNGTEHTLECSIRPGETVANVVWSELLPGGTSNTIYFGSNFGGNPEYADYILDTDTDRKWNLKIASFGIDDEGTYTCANSGSSESDVAERRVEVRSSSLQMTQDGSDTSPVTMRAGEPLDMVCTVVGARPIVEVWWYDQKPGESEQRLMTGVTQIDTDNGDGTFNSVSTLQYTATKDYNGGSLRCNTTGQEVAESRQDSATLDVQYEPDVTVSWNDPTVICSSDANPEVVDNNDYVIIVNGSKTYTPELNDGSYILRLNNLMGDTHIRCNATNTIGMGTADTIAVPGATTPEPPTPTMSATTKKSGGGGGIEIGIIILIIVIVILVVAAVIVVLIYIFVVKPKKEKNKPKNGGGATEMQKKSNGSGDKANERPTPAPRNSKPDAEPYHDSEPKKSTDNPDGLVYAAVDHSKSNQRPTNNIIRTEEPTEYADVKTFIV